jgi:hypothetical protein
LRKIQLDNVGLVKKVKMVDEKRGRKEKKWRCGQKKKF